METFWPTTMKIGSTLHELGHMAQYNRNTFTGYLTTSNLLLESWASYVGWYVGEAYYTSLGWVKPPETDYSNITNQSRQFWMSTNDNYSPMFVDLIDGYNQRARGTTYPNDNISVTNNSVHSQILYVADHILGLSGALDYLQSNVDCNKTDLSTYLSSYR